MKASTDFKPHLHLFKDTNTGKFQLNIIIKIPIGWSYHNYQQHGNWDSVEIIVKEDSSSTTSSCQEITGENIDRNRRESIYAYVSKKNEEPDTDPKGKATTHYDDADDDTYCNKLHKKHSNVS